MERIRIADAEPLFVRNICWLVHSGDDADTRNVTIEAEIRKLIENVQVFTDTKHVEEIAKTLTAGVAFLIVCESIEQAFLSRIHSVKCIAAIYLFSRKRRLNDSWIEKFSKIRGLFYRESQLIDRIQCDLLDSSQLNRRSESQVTIISAESNGRSTDVMSAHFFYQQILIDYILRCRVTLPEQIDEFLSDIRGKYASHKQMLGELEDFAKNYNSNDAIDWYTRTTGVFSLVNKALRTNDVDQIFLWRFFIRDLIEQLSKHQSESLPPFHVYRGTKLRRSELESLKEAQKHWICANSFLSASRSREVATTFIYPENNDLASVLFEIQASPSSGRTRPFANISSLSNYPNESEVLFSVGCIFRIEQISFNEREEVHQLKISLVDHQDESIQRLVDHKKFEYAEEKNELLQFAHLLRDVGFLEEAKNFYQRLTNASSSDPQTLIAASHGRGVVAYEQGDYHASIKFHYEALDQKIKLLGEDDPSLATNYNSIGTLYERLSDYDAALTAFEKAIEFFSRDQQRNRSAIAICLNNIAGIHSAQRQFQKAQKLAEKAIKIQQKILPKNHPTLAIAYANLATIYAKMNQERLALSNYQKSLNIYQRTLPASHPDIGQVFYNLGILHQQMDKLREARIYFKKALSIYQQSSASEHAIVNDIQTNIERLNDRLNSFD